MSVRLLTGDCRDVLKTLPSESVHCVVTSPPYFGLRDYGVGGQIGLEQSPAEYVETLVDVFREVRRVLRKDGTLWLNLGDSYANDDKWGGSTGGKHVAALHGNSGVGRQKVITGLKAKDLIGIPWMVAFALRADGWCLRQDIIWGKPNPMPESVTDRCTKAHEYVFLLSKSPRYYYDAEAIAEPVTASTIERLTQPTLAHQIGSGRVPGKTNGNMKAVGDTGSRNKRSVWTVATQPYAEAHFATFPPALIEPCILAGTSARGVCAECGAPWVRVVERVGEWRAQHDRQAKHNGEVYRTNPGGGIMGVNVDRRTIEKGWQPSCACNAAVVPATVCDPFAGAGTTALVADRLGRNAIGIELNPSYGSMAHARLVDDAGLFASVEAELRTGVAAE